MSMTASAGKRTRQRSWWIPWTFVGGFGVIIVVNTVLVISAFNSWSGLETEQAYERGLAFNQVLDATAAQAARGWQSAIQFSDGALDVRLRDRDGTGIEGLRVWATFVRPTNEGLDQTLRLAELGGGRYGAGATLPAAGNWDVRIRAEGRGEDWFAATRIWVAP